MKIKDITFHDSTLNNIKFDFEKNQLSLDFESYDKEDICNNYHLVFSNVTDLNISEIYKIKEAEIYRFEMENLNKINMEILILENGRTIANTTIKFSFNNYVLEKFIG